MSIEFHSAFTRRSAVERYLWFVVRHRIFALTLAFAVIAIGAVLARDLHKDTSANAYIEPDNPALLYRERVIEAFGLKEPIVVVIRAAERDGILDEAHLHLVRDVVAQLEAVPNVDADRITSLVSQSAITGGEDGLDIGPLLPEGEIDAALIAKLRIALADTPLYDGTLVASDRSATSIVVELIDESQSEATYRAVMSLVQSLAKPVDTQIYVAGAGAITGYFSSYIDRDAGRLVPFAAIAISIVLFCAFFTVRASAIPMLIAVATIVMTLGAMAASDVPFYAITNGMVVVLMGISVAEPMHVFGEYYALQRDRPSDSHEQLIVGALANVWRPIALTSVTTLGGFLSLWVTSTMPPIRYFGLFGAFGVGVAWVLTVTLLPALLALLSRRQSKLMRANAGERADVIARAMVRVGRVVIRHPRLVLCIAAIASAIALGAASQVKVDHARIENFNASEPLYIADREINRVLAGTNQLDIVIEANSDEGILQPEVLHRIDALQRFLSALPEVGGVTSIVNHMKQLNRATHGGAAGEWRVPTDASLIAQLMLTYQASAAPTELQSLIDASGRTALVRAYLPVDRWSDQRRVVVATQKYLEQAFSDREVEATLTGRVMLDYEWVQSVAGGHVLSVAVSTLTVLFMCIVIFRSIRDGLLCLAPLFVSVVGVYAVMGTLDIWLGVATSMFASIAIGLGIDFAIHMIARARKAIELTTDIDAGLLYVYRSTGRAVLFNAAAVGLGFGIVTLSAAPPIRMFGVLVATAMAGAFLAAITVLPAILKLMAERAARRQQRDLARALQGLMPLLCIVVLALGVPTKANADDEGHSDAARIMTALANRSDGATADRRAIIRLIDRHGGTREQVARAVRKNVADGRRMAIFYEAPANIRGTSFLVFDYRDAGVADDQWLYLPALRKVRRVPASDRGDYFLGTDLTFDEVRNDNRVTLTDWNFRFVGNDSIDGTSCTVIEGVAIDERIARELGYGRARWCVDITTLIARRIEYWDRAGAPLKTVTNSHVTQIDSIWSALRVQVTNHKTGHRTDIEFRDARFDTPLHDSLFTQQQMERGL